MPLGPMVKCYKCGSSQRAAIPRQIVGIRATDPNKCRYCRFIKHQGIKLPPMIDELRASRRLWRACAVFCGGIAGFVGCYSAWHWYP